MVVSTRFTGARVEETTDFFVVVGAGDVVVTRTAGTVDFDVIGSEETVGLADVSGDEVAGFLVVGGAE